MLFLEQILEINFHYPNISNRRFFNIFLLSLLDRIPTIMAAYERLKVFEEVVMFKLQPRID